MQRDIDGRHREADRPAAAAVMQLPPHALPQRFDLVGVGAHQDVAQPLVDQRVHRRPAGARGVGVADALGPIGVSQPDGHEFEMGHRAVGGIRQRHRQFDAIQRGVQAGDAHGRVPPLVVASQGAPAGPRLPTGTQTCHSAEPHERASALSRLSRPDRCAVGVSFLRRQYVGFSRLRPVWIGRTLLPDAAAVGGTALRLGGDGMLGPARRLLFRHLGRAPRFGVAYLERDRSARWERRARMAARMTPSGLPIALAPVLHAQFARGGALALPLAQALGCAMVVTLHGGDVSKRKNWQHTVLSQRWPALAREAAAFVCVSHAVADIALARGVTGRQDWWCCRSAWRSRTSRRPGARTAHLFVGRFVEKKGIAVLADAMRLLRPRAI